MFYKIIYKTSNGIYLNDNDEKYLLNCLGFKRSLRFYLYILINIILNVTIIIFASGFVVKRNNYLLLILILTIPSAIIFLHHYYLKNQKLYYLALDDYIKSEFDDFLNYSNYYTYVYDKDNLLDKSIVTNNVFFITNGYEFYVYNDFLEERDYYLKRLFKKKNNESPKLKVIARKKEKALTFYLKDIEEYYVYDKKAKISDKNYDPVTKVFSIEERKKYTSLKLKNGIEYCFGPEIYLCLKKYCPIGEINKCKI